MQLALAEAAAARARVTELEAQASRTRKLAEQAIVSALERETQEAQLAAAEASVSRRRRGSRRRAPRWAARRSTLDKTVIRSPIAGRVGRREVEVGMLVTPATVLFVVGDLEPGRRRRAASPRRCWPRSQTGHAGRDRRRRRWASGRSRRTLSRMSPFLARRQLHHHRRGRRWTTPPAACCPGMFVTADIAYGQSNEATLVPVSALWEDPRSGLLGVYVVERPAGRDRRRDRAPPRSACARCRSGPKAAPPRAWTGVAPGEWVVTIGQHLLAASEHPSARVRTAAWERVLELQARQQEDLLARIPGEAAAAGPHPGRAASADRVVVGETRAAGCRARGRRAPAPP